MIKIDILCHDAPLQLASFLSAAGDVMAVLDIDSRELATFDDTDRRHLEQICKLITPSLFSPPDDNK